MPPEGVMRLELNSATITGATYATGGTMTATLCMLAQIEAQSPAGILHGML